ncbi:15767_t:CDS:2 [Acaulospora colombiana]|uniref:15767_t:CDS:1 n=1 Tax=Acaulospora colombiana TaxID=27376 RepID=A0ACA9P2I4_9GLOM|nr:15767_t:CDS:2 [Acaulospora colombiana]
MDVSISVKKGLKISGAVPTRVNSETKPEEASCLPALLGEIPTSRSVVNYERPQFADDGDAEHIRALIVIAQMCATPTKVSGDWSIPSGTAFPLPQGDVQICYDTFKSPL